MNKIEATSVLQASLLLYEGMSEEEVRESVGDEYMGCAKGIVNFVRSYPL